MVSFSRLAIALAFAPAAICSSASEGSLSAAPFERRGVNPSCSQKISPSCIQALYNIPNKGPKSTKNILAVPGFDQDYVNHEDLSQFLQVYQPGLKGKTFSEEFIDGGQNPQNSQPDVDADLNIQYAVGLTNGNPVTYISSGKSGINGLIDLANYLLGQAQPPSVLVITYDFEESEVSNTSATKLCNLFQQLGSRGISVIVATGDGGGAGIRPSAECPKFQPTFPASCPYVTSVGGTTYRKTETAATLSAGGFSDYFGQPQYRLSSVKKYLNQLGSQYQGKYNRAGRAYPDVSAVSTNIQSIWRRNAYSVNGTSAAAVIFGFVISQLNAELITKGKSPLGFLNPWLYSHPEMFNDIATGSNPGCDTSGFPAKAGWDAVTGLGSPNYTKMKAVLGL